MHGSQSPIRLLRVSYCVIKSHIFFNMIQPIDLIFCKMIEIIEQTFAIVQIFYLGPIFFSDQIDIFSWWRHPLSNPET